MSHATIFQRVAHQAPRQHQTGFSLIELMVALTLGLFIVGGVISIFVTNQQAFRTTAALGRVQENARIAFELMARDVRQSGGNACGTPLVKNLLNNPPLVAPTPPVPPPTWSYDWAGGTIVGYTGTTDVTDIKKFGTSAASHSVNERVKGTDAVKVLGSALGLAAGIKKHTLSAAAATIELTPSISIGSNPGIVLACDGISGVIAQVTSVTTATVAGKKIDTLNFVNVAGTTSPGNCSTDFSFTTTCPPPTIPPPPVREFLSDGFVAPLSANFWYIGYNAAAPRDSKSLYRVSLTGTEEIAENVVGMQIAYLLRTEANGVLDPDWADASSVTDWKNDPSPLKKVVALRFTLQLETTDKVGTNQEVITRELIHVVNLRNRPD